MTTGVSKPMTDDDLPDVTPRDALEVAQRALAKANDLEREFDELREDYEDAVDDLVAVKLRLSEFDEDRAYKDYTRDDKIGIVREHAFRKAVDGRGVATLDYDDIKWGAFDGGPSPAHCYDLMKWAAQARGFEHKTPAEGNEHLRCDAQEAKRGAAFYSAKKDSSEGVVE